MFHPALNSANDPIKLMEGRICFIRGQKVMLDLDVADLHQISTKALSLAVRKNLRRFPDDFMFQLTADEVERLHLRLDGTAPSELPYAFTDLGIAMISCVLKGPRAVEVSLAITRALVQSGELSWDNLFEILSADVPRKRVRPFTRRAAAVNEY